MNTFRVVSAGASIIAQANCARLLRTTGPKDFADAGKGPGGRKDIAESRLKAPDIIFEDRLVLEDSKQRAEILFFGHAHTAGDTFLYLPRHKIVCTGDACTDTPRVVLAHNPQSVEQLAKHRADVVLSGHTHGGQINWPGLGRLMLGKKARRWAAGLYPLEAGHLYVNTGVGFGWRFRFGVRPELAIFTLQPA